jgi:ribosome maturation factor RimP
MKDDLEKRITLLAEPLLLEQGLEQVDLELSRQGSKLWIRFFVDRVAGGGVTVNECGEFNLAISRLLDVEDIVAGSYMLEVSSPGLDRRVRKVEDFIRFAGRNVSMVLCEPVAGRKKLKGLIVGADAEGVTVRVDGQELKAPHGSIARANLEYEPKRKG